jgi:hypothetical protein
MTYKKHEIEDLIEASSHYLTEELPHNFHKWKENKLSQFIEDHLCQAFEHERYDYVWDNINILARGTRRYIEKQLTKENYEG